MLTLSTSVYFGWATADDVYTPEHLAHCIDVLERDPNVVLVYPKTQFIDRDGRALDLEDPGWDLRWDSPQERLRYALFAQHWVNALYGLIRAEALRKTRLIARYQGGDYRVLSELALMGKFVEISDCVFLRRLHKGASSQNHAAAWQLAFYTGNGHGLAVPTWQRAMDDFIIIVRSDVSRSAKLSLLRSLLTRMRWQREQLYAELKVALEYPLSRTARRA